MNTTLTNIQKRKFPLASKSEIIQFIEQETSLKVNKIEGLGNGLIYCRLFEILFPGSLKTKSIKLLAKQEWDYQHNLRVLQKGFQQHNIEKNIEITKLAQCKFQDNLMFMQWFMKFFEENKKNIVEQVPIKKVKTSEVVSDEQFSAPSFVGGSEIKIAPLQELLFSSSTNKEEVRKDLNYELSACKMIIPTESPFKFLCEDTNEDKENISMQNNQNLLIIDHLFEKTKVDEN